MKIKKFHIPVFVPHKGCPHDCIFCNQRTITGICDEMTPDKAKAIIDKYLSTIEKYNEKGSYDAEIAFFGGSFTAIERDLMTELLSLGHSYVISGRVSGLRCSTRPDAISDEIVPLCKEHSMKTIELGVQSADEEVLSLSNRGHTFADVIKSVEIIKKHGIGLGLQMMTGLPGDTPHKSIQTAEKIASLAPECVRIYPTLVMEGTGLCHMEKRGEYSPQSLDEAVSLCTRLVKIFSSRSITILRIGLQTTDGVNASTVSGPYHPAFAELVYQRLCREEIEEKILSANLSDTILEIDAPENKISQIIGHKKENLHYFKEKYNITLKLNHKK